MANVETTMAELEAGLAVVLGPLPADAEPRVRLLLDEEQPALEMDISVYFGETNAFQPKQIEETPVGERTLASQIIAQALVGLAHGLMDRAELLTQATPEMIEAAMTEAERNAHDD